MEFTRRQLLKTSCTLSGLFLLNKLPLWAKSPSEKENKNSSPSKASLREVMFYRTLQNQNIECTTCPKLCRVQPYNRGICGNKENRGGKYYTLAYGKACAAHIDPIEKKPLFHYLPNTTAFSLSTAGCNFTCKYCQNWQISQSRPEDVDNLDLPPKKVVELAHTQNCRSIAFTYAEPTVFYEYMYDIARLAKLQKITSVMISNGYINKTPLRELCKYLNAVKIDLKSFNDEFYQKYCAGRLKPVLETLTVLKEAGIWFEIVVLLVTTLNDSAQEIKKMCTWIKNTLGPDVPLHFSRFHPQYKLTNLPPTSLKTMETSWQIAKDTGLKFVYLGNVPSHPAESTYCPCCQKLLIKRTSYSAKITGLEKGQCKYCREPIPGIWD